MKRIKPNKTYLLRDKEVFSPVVFIGNKWVARKCERGVIQILGMFDTYGAAESCANKSKG